ncbi:hypothetical protein BOX15_Mlig016666g2 [Macrostomum lignano]|nr:hypothetical protein BOX15_Mlig016666g2 [Macrostomum lignano]
MSSGRPGGGGGGGGGGGAGQPNRNPANIPRDLRKQMSNERLTDLAAITASAGGGAGDDGKRGGTIASRPTYNEVQLEEEYQIRLEPSERKAHRINLMQQRKANQFKEKKDIKTKAMGILNKAFPCINVFVNYKVREYAVFDLISGVSVGLFIIPQAIAFSLLANVKPQYGFYSAFFAMLIYFIFGTSNHLNMSSQGAVSLIVGEAVRAGVQQVYPNGVGLCETASVSNAGLYTGNESTTIATESTTMALVTTAPNVTTGATAGCINRDDANAMVALSITMVAGLLQILLGALQLGFLTIYMSDPLNSAFTCGAALHIVSSQLGNLLGAKIPAINGNGKFFMYFIEAFKRLFTGQVNGYTIGIFVAFFALLLAIKLVNEKCSKYVKIPIPIDIIVLITSLLMSQFMNWKGTIKVENVGVIRQGFEVPRAPLPEHFTSGSGILVNGIVLGIISYALSVSVAKTFALRHGYEVDANQEVLAYGFVNFGMSWFSTFVSASSIACTSLHESMRGKTLIYSVYATIITLISILTFCSYFEPVPKCVLSAIIIVNLKNMILQVEQLPRLWRTNRYDFSIWIVTLAAILGLDLPIGLGIGVAFSLLTIIYRTQAPKAYLLGRVPKTDIYRNIKKIKGAEEIPGLKIFKFDGSLYFASADNFRKRLFRSVAMNPKKILERAKAAAKRSGGASGDMNLRTDVLNAQGIKEVLGVVKEEGSHPSAIARQRAQLSSSEELKNLPITASKSYESMGSIDSADLPASVDSDDESEPTVNVFCIILDLSACAFIDAVGVRLLTKIVDDFSKIGVEMYLSGCTSLVRSLLRKANFFDKRSEAGLFVTVHDAVIYALSNFYQELVEDETGSSIGEQGGASTSGVSLSDRRVSISQHANDAARERRRQTRTYSISHSAGEDPSLHGVGSSRRPSECVRHLEAFSGYLHSIHDEQQQQLSLPEYSSLDHPAHLCPDLRHRSSGFDSAVGQGDDGHLRALPEDGLDNQGYHEETRF